MGTVYFDFLAHTRRWVVSALFNDSADIGNPETAARVTVVESLCNSALWKTQTGHMTKRGMALLVLARFFLHAGVSRCR